MRFDSLTIPAFGPFTDFSLKFPEAKYDLHLIYGANEAGKSSLLRAIHHLFFGVPSRTSDNFIHANAKLLLGAGISEGSEKLAFFRKKGLRNTLLDASQNSLNDTALQPFLGSVNEEFFQHMFGLTTESLRSGAAKLLSGEGDLGTTLFSASLGGSPIDDAIKKLEAEANSLCRGAAKKDTTILPAIAQFKESEKAARAEITSTTAWRFVKAEVKHAHESFEEKDGLYRSHRARWQLLADYLRAFPVLEAIRSFEVSLAEIEVPGLPSDFPERVRKLQAQLVRSQQAHELHRGQIERAEEALEKIGDFKEVISAAPEFEWLRRKAEHYADHLEILPALKNRLTETDLEKLPAVGAAEQTSLQESAATLTELTGHSKEVTRALENLRIELAAQTTEASAPDDLSELEDQCQRADAFMAEKAALPSLEKKLAALRSEQGRFTARLEITGDPASLKVPGAKTIQAAGREYEKLREDVRDVESRLAEVRDHLSEEKTSLDILASQAAIHTEADLAGSRQERDDLWQKILKSQSVDEGLTGAIEHADELADALRDHADHLAMAAGHQAKISQLQSKQDHLALDFEKADQALREWEESWEPDSFGKTPIALLEWRDDWERLCEIVEEAEAIQAEIVILQEKEARFLEEFKGDDFGKVHRSLKTAFKRANQEQGELKALQKLVAKNEVKRDQLELEERSLAEQLEREKRQWQLVCEAAGVSRDLSPKVAVEAVTERMKARELLLDYQVRQDAVDEYDKRLQTTAKRLKMEASEPALAALFEKSKFDQSRGQTLQEQLDQLRESLPEVTLSFEGDVAAMEALIQQAGSHDLEAVILQVESKSALTTRLNEQKGVLLNLAGTHSLEDFVEELKAQDPAELAGEKVALDQAEEGLQLERDDAKAHLDAQLRSQREMMKASDLAATQKQAAADALATVVADTERFRQLHYAIDFLKEQVEGYRQKTQGPMIEKTSSFFQALTCGGFERVAAQLDEKEKPQLIAIRAGAEAVSTPGLSEGTADQLYLALRLAAIDLHLENHPAIPLILDDLLMTFDDERTRALLPVLEELSQKTQVLIFTHHSHLKELAGPKVVIHDLPA